jgi:protein-S-isoprenylcysteine O-methyltransferase Ste14
MYAGMGILLLGEAWLMWRMEIVYMTLICFAAVSAFIVFYEEPVLRTKFGDDYIEYCRNVRRWIPRLRPFDNSQPAA